MIQEFNNQIWTYRPKRVNIWKRFVNDVSGDILVCGLDEIEYKIAPCANLVNTKGDYNYNTWHPNSDKVCYKTVFCFEVLEHLVNPLLFLERLKMFCDSNTNIYISFPSGRPEFLWTNAHFHEYSKKRAETLFKMAGLNIVKRGKSGIIWKNFSDYLKGFRPLLRLFFPLNCRLYHLRII